MLTLMLDGHRATCETCTNILEEANVGVFHGDEDKLKMDLSGKVQWATLVTRQVKIRLL